MNRIELNTDQDLERAIRDIHALSDRYARTEVAEYRGQLHVRAGRRVVAVVDYVEGWARFNETANREQVARVNDVLEILGSNLRAGLATAEVDGLALQADVWLHYPAADPVKLDEPAARSIRLGREQVTFTALLSPLAALWPEQPARCTIVDNLRDLGPEAEAANRRRAGARPARS